ncbi:ferredoxin reductase [Frankia sp. Cppng1_Ct_nod]|uniref:ferredoxin reductase n=1 Tax=Frankia sp. Cppng1_Ct_nod TaxID=2897162 RepID=UPI001041631B|nr:ferredoxin reductase [Frankia sp. Cppng1_Ct_nod]
MTSLSVDVSTGIDAENAERIPSPSIGRRLFALASWLTTPLLPDDYLELVDPLWSSRGLRGRVEAVRPETGDAVTLVIRPGPGWNGHQAGQYVPVGVDVDGVRHWRTYSLTSAPEHPDGCITVTVKVVPGGGVSPYLAHRIRAGTVLRLGPAQGRFVLPRPLVSRLLFLTAGSGITPVMGMLRSLAARGEMPDAVLVHCAPTADDVIFGAELRGLAVRFPSLRLYERHTRVDAGDPHRGRLTMAQLSIICPDHAEREVWACGPRAMLDDAEAHWRHAGIAGRLHVERFHPVRPAVVSGGGAGGGGRVRFVGSGREADADGGTPLLTVGEAAGVLMPSGCRMGICHSCVTPLVSGRVRDLRTGREHGDEGELIQTCVSAAAGDVEIDL